MPGAMKFKALRINRPVLWLILLALTGARLALVFKGHFHLQDELRYRYTFAFIRELIQGQLVEAARQLFAFPLFARPLLVLFNLPSAFLQVFFLLLAGTKTETPVSLSLASATQALVTVGISWVFYRISRYFLCSSLWSLTAMILYSLLINTNLYIRHILPYDATLLIYLILLLWVLTQSRKKHLKLSWLSGLVVGLVHLIYPAYYLFGLVMGWLTTLLPRGGTLKRGVAFVLPIVIVVGVTEFTSRTVGVSYLQTAAFVTSRVVVGDPHETPLFLYRYLLDVEGMMGKLLVVGFSIFLVHFAIRWRQYPREFRLLALGMVGAYVLHGVSGPLLGKVFYGRSVRMFFWFVILAVMMSLRRMIPKARIQRLMALGLVGVSLVSFSQWYPQFLRLAYPGDVLYSVCQAQCSAQVSEVNENYAPESLENHPIANPEYLAINFGRFFFPEENSYEYDSADGRLIFQAPHPINFTAYQFEALTPQERELIKERNYQMKLFHLP